MNAVAILEIQRAAQRIQPFVECSPVVRAEALSRLCASDVRLKLENLQPTGSFKIRGAANALLMVKEDAVDARGIVTFSTGNHGRAIAFVARSLGLPVTVCVAESVSDAKLSPLRDSGAELHVEGATQDDAAIVARTLAAERGLELVEPFDDPRIIAGQGTIGLEILEQVARAGLVLVPVSGGGLIGGIALAIKSLRPDVRVVGVCAAHAPAMFESARAGRPIESAELPTLADSLRGGIGAGNRWTLDLIRTHVDDLVTVTEQQIADGLVYGLHQQGLVLEGAAVVGVAALMHGIVDVHSGESAVVIITGRNVDVADLSRVDSDLGRQEIGNKAKGGTVPE